MVELKDIIRENDLTGEVLSYHTGGLTKVKIDTAVVANGFTVPLPNKVSFHLYKMEATTPPSATDVWLVTWLPIMAKYAVEKLTLK